MNKKELNKTIGLLIHQNLCVVNKGTEECPDFVVGGTELLNKELTKLFYLTDVIVPKGMLCKHTDEFGNDVRKYVTELSRWYCPNCDDIS